VTTERSAPPPLPRLTTGIPGLDEVTAGGLPAGEVTLVGGVTGSGKTVLAMQYLVEGVRRYGQPGVFVTFAEKPDKLRHFVGEFGWDVAAMEEAGTWVFVDATLDAVAHAVVIGERPDFEVLVARIAAAVQRVGARRVALDSLNDLFARIDDRATVRDAVSHLVVELERMNVTTVVTVARHEDYGDVTPLGVAEFVADNIVLLRNPLERESRRRTVEVVKFRGTGHRRGEFPFAITGGEGLVVIPLSVSLRQASSDERTSTGNPVLDEMLGGGLFRDSVTLLSGATGIGKTTLALGFTLAAVAAGEPAVFVGFEESTTQLARSIRGWGHDLEELQRQGRLVVINDYPEVASLEEHVVRIKGAVDSIGARRLALDSLTTVQRAGSERGNQEFAVGLTAYLKERRVTGLLTTVQGSLWGSTSATDEHVSVLSDGIILLRYVEVHGEIRRGIVVLKHRGSWHDKAIHEFTIEPEAVRIGGPFHAPTVVLGADPGEQGLGPEPG
jgi:circadian clock protein KaiC